MGASPFSPILLFSCLGMCGDGLLLWVSCSCVEFCGFEFVFWFYLRFRDDCASGPLIFLGVFVLFLCDFCHGNYRRIYNS